VAITIAVEDTTLGQEEDHSPELVIPVRIPIFRDIELGVTNGIATAATAVKGATRRFRTTSIM
jgi:hypothetical protein